MHQRLKYIIIHIHSRVSLGCQRLMSRLGNVDYYNPRKNLASEDINGTGIVLEDLDVVAKSVFLQPITKLRGIVVV